MPYVLQFNRKHIENKMTRLASYLDLPTPSFDSVLTWLLDLRDTLQIPHTLSELNIKNDHIRVLAEEAFKDPSTPSNPRELTPNNLEQLIIQTINGAL